MNDKEKKKIYECHPDTGQIRWRYEGENPDNYGYPNYGNMLNKNETWGKMPPPPLNEPVRTPDAPWIDERVNESESHKLLNEDKNDEQEDTVCIIPDRSYAKIYQTIIILKKYIISSKNSSN